MNPRICYGRQRVVSYIYSDSDAKYELNQPKHTIIMMITKFICKRF